MTFWNSDTIKAVCAGTWIARRDDPPQPSGVCTDSRTLKPGEVFVAIKGDTFDGHEFLTQVASKGAAFAIVHRRDCVPPELLRELSVLLVPDTGVALLKLAAAYRKTLDTTRVVAVGGSNGKTTTTRLIESVLSRSLRGTASIKSFNNAVGVPLTILGAKKSDQYLICEVGTNAPGEICTLTEVVQPDVAVITSIGREHLEGLASIDGVAREEASLLKGLRSGGVAVLNADAPLLLDLVNAGGYLPDDSSVITFGTDPNADIRVRVLSVSSDRTLFRLNDRTEYEVPLPGRHNALNAAAAVAVARRFGLDDQAAQAGLAALRPPEMRLEQRAVAGVRLLNDSYNANPDSVLASLATFDECFPASSERRVVILGDMLELGNTARDAHREIGDAVASLSGIDLAVFIGPLMAHAADRVSAGRFSGTVVALPDATDSSMTHAASLLRPGDAVLLKGSRRMALERIIGALAAFAEPKPDQRGVSDPALARSR